MELDTNDGADDGWGYDPDNDQTWFRYKLVPHDGPQNLSHWVIGLCTWYTNEDTSAVAEHWNGQEWTPVQGSPVWVEDDPTTHVRGWKFDWGFTASNADDYRFYLYVDGVVSVGLTDWGAKAGNNIWDGQVLGPTCVEPDGSVTASKSGNDICIPDTITWIVEGFYSSNVPVDIDIVDADLGQSQVLTAQPPGDDVPFSVTFSQPVDPGEGGELSNNVTVTLYAAGTEDVLGEQAEASFAVTAVDLDIGATATVRLAADGTEVTDEVPYGTEVYIEYTVTNNSAWSVDVEIDDPHGTLGPTTLAPGQTAPFTTSPFTATGDLDYTADVTAVLEGSLADQLDLSECSTSADPQVVLLVGDPHYGVDVELSLDTACDGTGYYDWSGWVENTSDETIDITVVFSRAFDPITFNDVAPGTVEEFHERETGSGVKSLTVTATGPQGTGASDTATVESDDLQCDEPEFGVDVELTGSGDCGTGFTWVATVTNSSSFIADVNVDFDRSGIADEILEDMDPGEIRTVTRIEEGTGVRALTVTASIGEDLATASDDASVTLTCETRPEYGVEVELTGEGDCGTGFTWVATVTNNSSVEATIDVDFDRPEVPGDTVTLNPGASATITRFEEGTGTRSLEVTAFLRQGEIEDVAEATATAECPTCESEPSITLDVTSSNGSSRVPRGTKVDFFYTVTNTGDVPVDVVVTAGTLEWTILGLAPEASETLTEEDVAIRGTTTRSATATATVEDQLCGEDVATGSHTVRNPSTPPPPSYGVDVSLTGSADCETGFTWVATVTNRSDSAVTVNVDFDRDGIADQTVSLGAGGSQQLTRTEEGTGNKDLSVTATVAGRSESDSATASAGVECVPPPPPGQPPEVCVPVIKVHVMDESEAGIGGALVKMGDWSTTTAADGWATFPGLPAGTYQINVVASGYVPGHGSVTLEAGACEVTTHVTVRPPTFPPPPPPPPTGNITGNICLLEGLDAVEVRLQNGQTALVQSGGSYSFEGLPAGTYTVSASSNLGADSQTVSIGGESPLDAVVDFCFQAAPAQAPLPRTGGPLWPSYAGGMVLLALGMVLRRRIG